ncbi:hypothetical protein [Teredinibacter turnerae]|uniref:hypothetical protein n=1 Tax=Teredinibacter turnerae TaxID=2426 RepID=UPI001E41BBE2|nr:hypothetical protein [Teredinibacter turnerae]
MNPETETAHKKMMHSLAATAGLAPLGLVITRRNGVLSTPVAAILLLIWLSALGLLLGAAGWKGTFYAALLSNALVALFLFGFLPPKYGRTTGVVVVQRVFVFACICGILLSHFPLVDYVQNPTASGYAISNPRITLVFSNVAALGSVVLSCGYALLAAVCFITARKY